ncbi:LysR family transcriptional regulator [Methylobacterium sp. HMF5984]|uniref:LysR family transcriptional regulator n=1 Tax=Methylobacterium sp. HMF5984 TaxID=3367370 RepID=UPI003854D7A0
MPKKPRDLEQLDWEDIRLFLVVTQAGSIRAAAKRLDVHHSTVARRVLKLEETLNQRLICAGSAGVSACHLTQKGHTLLELAQSMFDAAEKINHLKHHHLA